MKRNLIVLLGIALLIFVGACATSAPETIIVTAIPESTQVPTSIPLSDLDLSQYIAREGDLPAGISLAQSRDESPGVYWERNDIEVILTFYQQLEKKGEVGGAILIFIYDSPTIAAEVFDGIDGRGLNLGIGERASVSTAIGRMNVSFRRCSTVVWINMAAKVDSVKAYAERLDSRLEEVVCR